MAFLTYEGRIVARQHAVSIGGTPDSIVANAAIFYDFLFPPDPPFVSQKLEYKTAKDSDPDA